MLHSLSRRLSSLRAASALSLCVGRVCSVPRGQLAQCTALVAEAVASLDETLWRRGIALARLFRRDRTLTMQPMGSTPPDCRESLETTLERSTGAVRISLHVRKVKRGGAKQKQPVNRLVLAGLYVEAMATRFGTLSVVKGSEADVCVEMVIDYCTGYTFCLVRLDTHREPPCTTNNNPAIPDHVAAGLLHSLELPCDARVAFLCGHVAGPSEQQTTATVPDNVSIPQAQDVRPGKRPKTTHESLLSAIQPLEQKDFAATRPEPGSCCSARTGNPLTLLRFARTAFRWRITLAVLGSDAGQTQPISPCLCELGCCFADLCKRAGKQVATPARSLSSTHARGRGLSVMLTSPKALPFASESLDAVVLDLAIENSIELFVGDTQSYRTMVAEAWRTLCPGGRLLLLSHARRPVFQEISRQNSGWRQEQCFKLVINNVIPTLWILRKI